RATQRDGRKQAPAMRDRDNARRVVDRAEKKSPHEWTAGQREAVGGLLTSTNRVTAIQGYAGTAKTSTVLRTVAAEAQRDGVQVRGLAPTASAAESLREGAGIRQANTDAGHPVQDKAGREQAARNELRIVDEAGML